MKAYNIFYYNSQVGREYAESSWHAIDEFHRKKENYIRKYLRAIPVQKPIKKFKKKKQNG